MLKDIQTIFLLITSVFGVGFGAAGYLHHDPQIKDNSNEIVSMRLDIVRNNQKEIDLEDKFEQILDNLKEIKANAKEKQKR